MEGNTAHDAWAAKIRISTKKIIDGNKDLNRSQRDVLEHCNEHFDGFRLESLDRHLSHCHGVYVTDAIFAYMSDGVRVQVKISTTSARL